MRSGRGRGAVYMPIISNGPFHLQKSISLGSIIFYFGYIVYHQNEYFPWIRWSQIHLGPFIFSTKSLLSPCRPVFGGLGEACFSLFFQPSHSSVPADLSLVDLVRPASLISCFTVSPMSPLNLLSLFSLICPGSTSGVGSVNQRLCVLWVLIILGPSVSQKNTTSNTSFFGKIFTMFRSMTSIYFCADKVFFS